MKSPSTINQFLVRSLIALPVLVLSSCASVPAGFKKADVDMSGSVSKSEFDSYMSGVIFSEADINGDSFITFEELKQANPRADEAGFNQADADGDGKVSADEARQQFARTGVLADLFNKVDSDGSGTIVRQEAKAAGDWMNFQSGTRLEKLWKAAEEFPS